MDKPGRKSLFTSCSGRYCTHSTCRHAYRYPTDQPTRSTTSRPPRTSKAPLASQGRLRADGRGVAWLHATQVLSLFSVPELAATTEGQSSRGGSKVQNGASQKRRGHVHGAIVCLSVAPVKDVEDQVERQTVPSPRRGGTEVESKKGGASESP